MLHEVARKDIPIIKKKESHEDQFKLNVLLILVIGQLLFAPAEKVICQIFSGL